MVQEIEMAGSQRVSHYATVSNEDFGREEERYSTIHTQQYMDEPAADAVRVEVADSPGLPPSYHLLDPNRDTTKKIPSKPTLESLTETDDSSSYDHRHDGDGRRHLPPKTLTPLTNGQTSLLFLELLVVLGLFILSLKGFWMLPHLDLFSVPSMSQDCGGYSVPAVERSFYINLQIVKDLSFTRAKLLDLAWDTILGQGGRFLHGWVLYQVAASQLTWMMEYSSVPYHFQLNILFSTASLPALWSTLRFLGRKRPARAVFSAVWFLLAIVYVLAFTSVWGAATGYLNPSKPAYLMGDHSYVTADSDSLNLCMSVDTERLNGTVPPLVQGPQFSNCFDSFSDIVSNWATCDIRQGSDDWTNIIAYFNDWEYSYQKPSIQGAMIFTDQSSGQYYHTTDQSSKVQGLYRQLKGFQFASAGQENEVSEDEPWFNTTFQLDPSVNVSGWERYSSEPIPYNSTLWWNGSAIALDAPFIDVYAREADCDWFPVRGMCLCYRDALLTSDFRRDDNLVCISEEGYVWGFSSVITLVGIILELCWVVGCLGMWLDVHINSNNFRMNRRGSGLVRNILDAAGAIQNDLGRDTGAYRDGTLMKELEKLPPVGYEVDDSGQHSRISIVSMPGVRRRGDRLKPGKLYA
ncbi:hypothetical protein J7T55_002773 [Diaporthe amygdali]|uniref:uncharacterized protein n=1 Tax=Phomopsis amygdali TaxID=1214568 RepID=UPI0022FEA1CC|nr:uncharacterized protein J7T55_002773 [Diaporthe amygdali]KAJ0122261.1 hypothetical protein J7T55_002773 [Diaporthe amygdali]